MPIIFWNAFRSQEVYLWGDQEVLKLILLLVITPARYLMPMRRDRIISGNNLPHSIQELKSAYRPPSSGHHQKSFLIKPICLVTRWHCWNDVYSHVRHWWLSDVNFHWSTMSVFPCIN